MPNETVRIPTTLDRLIGKLASLHCASKAAYLRMTIFRAAGEVGIDAPVASFVRKPEPPMPVRKEMLAPFWEDALAMAKAMDETDLENYIRTLPKDIAERLKVLVSADHHVPRESKADEDRMIHEDSASPTGLAPAEADQVREVPKKARNSKGREAALRASRGDVSVREAARDLGITWQAVYGYMKRHQVEIKKRPKEDLGQKRSGNRAHVLIRQDSRSKQAVGLILAEGLTVKEAAQRIGITPGAIYLYLAGRDDDRVAVLAQAKERARAAKSAHRSESKTRRAIALMRNGAELGEAAKQLGIHPRSIKNHLHQHPEEEEGLPVRWRARVESPPKVTEAISMVRDGRARSLAEAARTLGLKPSTVTSHLHMHPEDRHGVVRGFRPPDPKTVEAVELVLGGMDVKEACHRTGVKRWTVYPHLRKAKNQRLEEPEPAQRRK